MKLTRSAFLILAHSHHNYNVNNNSNITSFTNLPFPLHSKGQSNSTVGRVFELHAADLGSIPDIQVNSRNPPEVTPKQTKKKCINTYN